MLSAPTTSIFLRQEVATQQTVHRMAFLTESRRISTRAVQGDFDESVPALWLCADFLLSCTNRHVSIPRAELITIDAMSRGATGVEKLFSREDLDKLRTQSVLSSGNPISIVRASRSIKKSQEHPPPADLDVINHLFPGDSNGNRSQLIESTLRQHPLFSDIDIDSSDTIRSVWDELVQASSFEVQRSSTSSYRSESGSSNSRFVFFPSCQLSPQFIKYLIAFTSFSLVLSSVSTLRFASSAVHIRLLAFIVLCSAHLMHCDELCKSLIITAKFFKAQPLQLQPSPPFPNLMALSLLPVSHLDIIEGIWSCIAPRMMRSMPRCGYGRANRELPQPPQLSHPLQQVHQEQLRSLLQ